MDVVGYESSWLLLSCDHVLSLPQATVLWLKEDLIERLITGSDSLEILLNGSLLFSDLSSADEAMYICLASNPSTLEFRRVVYNLTISTGYLMFIEVFQYQEYLPSKNPSKPWGHGKAHRINLFYYIIQKKHQR